MMCVSLDTRVRVRSSVTLGSYCEMAKATSMGYKCGMLAYVLVCVWGGRVGGKKIVFGRENEGTMMGELFDCSWCKIKRCSKPPT